MFIWNPSDWTDSITKNRQRIEPDHNYSLIFLLFYPAEIFLSRKEIKKKKVEWSSKKNEELNQHLALFSTRIYKCIYLKILISLL